MTAMGIIRNYNDKVARIWYKDVHLGKRKYVIQRGVLTTGTPMFLLAWAGTYFDRGYDPIVFSVLNLVSSFVALYLIGAWFGLMMWNNHMEKFGRMPEG